MPITPLKNYNPDEIIVIVGGADIRTWADGVMVSIDYLTDQYQEVVGTGGEVARSRSNDYRANITLRLMQTGDDNDLLSELFRADQIGNGAGVFPIEIRDSGSGRMLFQAAEAWIVKPPAVSLDRTAQAWEWQLRTAYLRAFYGGS